MVLAEPIQITKIITTVLEELEIPYFIGGSIASSLHGIPRATQDVDLVADIHHEHIRPLVKNLTNEFYVDDGR